MFQYSTALSASQSRLDSFPRFQTSKCYLFDPALPSDLIGISIPYSRFKSPAPVSIMTCRRVPSSRHWLRALGPKVLLIRCRDGTWSLCRVLIGQHWLGFVGTPAVLVCLLRRTGNTRFRPFPLATPGDLHLVLLSFGTDGVDYLVHGSPAIALSSLLSEYHSTALSISTRQDDAYATFDPASSSIGRFCYLEQILPTRPASIMSQYHCRR